MIDSCQERHDSNRSNVEVFRKALSVSSHMHRTLITTHKVNIH